MTAIYYHAHTLSCFEGIFYTVPLSLAVHDSVRGGAVSVTHETHAEAGLNLSQDSSETY